MEHWMIPSQGTGALTERLLAQNGMTARFGLSLTAEQAAALAQGRETALRDTGRVEFGEGILPALIHAFCDSPWVEAETWAGTLMELQELFYHCKSAYPVADDGLLALMRRVFDNEARGETALLADRLGPAIERALDGRKERTDGNG